MNLPKRNRAESIWQTLEDDFKFSKIDLGWVKTLWAYTFRKYYTVPYRPQPAQFGLPVQCKIAMVGDWGTGTPEAYKVMGAICRKRPNIVIHLGDVYYSGTKREMKDRFMTPLRACLTGDEFILSLCGNHDVYSGGAGYYWLVDKLGQASSFFTLSNPYLQIMGLDTGHSDFDPWHGDTVHLHAEEAAWAKNKIAEKKTIVLTHHQPFSAFEFCRNQLLDQLGTKMAAWFAGHEHRLAIYEPYNGVTKFRCIGAGAVPEFVKDNYFESHGMCKDVPYGSVGVRYKHSFVMLNVDHNNVWAEYFDEDGRRLYMEQI